MGALSSCACDRYLGIRGTVRDAGGVSVVGASIELAASGTHRVSSATSDQRGAFDVGLTYGLFPGNFTLSVEKAGFKAVRYSPKSGVHRLAITLSRTGEPAASSVVSEPTPSRP